MEVEIALQAVVAFLNLGLGIYVLFKRPHHIVNRAFFVFASGIFVWGISMFLLYQAHLAPFIAVTLLGGEATLLGFVLIGEVFPNGSVLTRRSMLRLVPLFVLAALTPSRLFIASVNFSVHGRLEAINGSWFPVFALVILVYALAAATTLFRRYRRSNGVARAQLLYLFLGAAAFIMPALVADVLLPAFRVFTFNLIGPLFSVFFVACTAYAIVRHKLMDIEVVIKRSVAYALTLLAIAGIFFGIEFIVEKFFFNDELVDIAAGMIGGFCFNMIRRKFETLTDFVFFRKEYDYARAIQDLGSLLNGAGDLAGLADAADRWLMETVRPERSVLLLEEGAAPAFFKEYVHDPRASSCDPDAYRRRLYSGEGAQDSAITMVIPFEAGEGRRGAVLLGEKLSGAAFDEQDAMILAVLANQLGMAVQNILLYQTMQDRRGEQESQSRFLADIAHELQTPVAILKANLEVVNRRAAGDRKTSLRVIDITLDRMSQMVGSLLAAARLRFSGSALHEAPIEVADLLEEIYGDCLALVEEKGISLFFSASRATVLGDRNQLKTVILNLVSNALKHTPRGGSITLHGEAAGGTAKISVADTGSGIPGDKLAHIFDRFYRIQGDVSGGTGIGLDICKKIVEAHGGSIEVESAEGRGSVFTICLPLRAAANPVPLRGSRVGT